MYPRFQLEIFEVRSTFSFISSRRNEVDVHDIPIATITDQ